MTRKLFDLIKQKQELLPPHKDLVMRLEQAIINSQPQFDAKEGYFRSSSLKCVRDMYYRYVGAPMDSKKRTAASIAITELGTQIHENIQKYIQKIPDLEFVDVSEYVKELEAQGHKHLEVLGKVGAETSLLDKDLMIKFQCDGILRFNGSTYILEIKSETSSKNKVRDDMAEEHLAQAACYSHSLKIKDIIFLYVNRDFGNIKPYWIQLSDDTINKVLLEPIHEVFRCVKEGASPEKPEASGKGSFCRYCNYITSCATNYTGDKNGDKSGEKI